MEKKLNPHCEVGYASAACSGRIRSQRLGVSFQPPGHGSTHVDVTFKACAGHIAQMSSGLNQVSLNPKLS